MRFASSADETRWRDALIAKRGEKDRAFRLDPHSPIPDRAHFDGLRYFDPDPSFRILADVQPPPRIAGTLPTSTGESRSYEAVASLLVEHVGIQGTLVAFAQEDAWFVPFRDATSGKETYGGGRYLEIRPDARLVIDFNEAYNPFCAYDDGWSCAVPPPENTLPFAVKAGEKVFAPH
ncbi:MAG: DUF1684 domain-containing protein [Thermoplasmatota archaeon]